jgi:transposase
MTTTDVLGRRSGPRRRRTIEEKRQIVEETLAPGASVPVIARKHDVNANLVFGWRRLYQQGLLEVRDAGVALAMLPVKAGPALHTRKSKHRVVVRRGPRQMQGRGSIEIRFANGQSIRVQGRVDGTALAQVIEILAHR